MALKIAWTYTAWTDLEVVAEYIAKDSRYCSVLFVQQAREASRSLTRFAEKGRVVPEFGDAHVRELFVMITG